MIKSLRWKAFVIGATVLLCIYGVVGIPKSKADIIANWNKNIRLGLDLRGGSHLVLQVQVQDAFKAEADRTIERMKDDFQKAGVDYASMERNDPGSLETAETIEIRIKGVPIEKGTALRSQVTDRYSNWVLAGVGPTEYRLTMRPSDAISLRRETVLRSMTTIERRINGLGLAEASVQQRGSTETAAQLLVQMPGVDDPARVRSILQTAALLEIVEVKDGPFSSEEQARSKNGGVLPLNTRLVKMASRAGENVDSWYLLNRTSVITGQDVRNATAGRDEFQKWETSFTLSQDGARRFGRFTEANIGNRLAVVLDTQIRSVATIQNRIEDNGRITNQGNEQEASDLALVLRAGSLPAGILPLEERTVGASLGADSIRQGLITGLVGLAIVFAAMLTYYRGAGVNASIALVLNSIILIACLSYFEAVLTLPGMAGVILGIGMAVDSNVLIFERIKEELRAGKAVVAAVQAGFDRAWLTIIDTHVTTVVSCAFLFLFGTAAIKGFAVTLLIGLIANVFTAVFVSRFLFDWHLSRRTEVAALSI